MKILTSNRFKSFYWRTGAMALAAGCAAVASNLNMLNLSGSETVILGLIFGELSKGLNNIASSV